MKNLIAGVALLLASTSVASAQTAYQDPLAAQADHDHRRSSLTPEIIGALAAITLVILLLSHHHHEGGHDQGTRPNSP